MALHPNFPRSPVRAIPSLHQQFLEAAGDGICWVDAGGTITFANSKAAELLGCTGNALTGCPLDSVVQDAALIRTLLTQATRGLQSHCEPVLPQAAGKAHPLSLTAHPILSEEGEPTSTLVTFTPYDAPHGRTDAAAASEEHFRTLFESIDEGVAIIEVYFDEQDKAIDYKVLEINAAHEAMSGLGREIIGKRIRELMPDVPKNLLERVGQVALTGQPIRFEEFVSGLGRWFDIYLARDGGSDSRRVISVSNNITERKRRERLQAFLLTLSDALRPLVDPQAIQMVAADLLGEHLQVNQALYGEVRGEHIYISHSYANGLAPMVGTFHPEDFGKRLIDGHRAGRLQVCVNTTSDPLFEEQERKALAAAHVGAYIAVPLIKEGVWVAVLSIHNIQPRDWAPTEVEAVREVAERTWAAVERARAENALSRSEQKYRSLFESIDEGVSTIEVLFDEQDKAIDYRFLEFNAAHEAMSGVPRDVIGKRGSEVIGHVEPSVMERLGQVALTGQPIRFEEFVSGLGRWFDIYSARDGGSDSRRVISVFRNITERKRRERLQAFLLTLSDALRPLIDPQAIQIVAADLLGEHLQVNHALYGEVRGEHTHVSHSYANGLPPMVGAFHNESFGKRMIEGHRAGRLQVCVNTTSDPLYEEEERKALAAVHVGAFIAVPLVKQGVWVAVLSVQNIQPRNWAPTEIEAVQEVAERTWAAVERTRAERALSRSEEKYRSLFESRGELLGRLAEVEEDERRSIHRELHDRIGQDLASAKLNIDLARSSAADGARLDIARDLVQSAIDNSRDIMAELRPPGLDDHGLAVALELYAEAVAKRLSISVTVRGIELEHRLPPLAETSFFRIAQEAINNLAKHANARNVDISLHEEARKVRLTISDDGSGFDVARLPEAGCYGFQIMRERAEAVDARLEIESAPGRGTRIIAILERTA